MKKIISIGGRCLFESETAKSEKELVVESVRMGADLEDARLARTDLAIVSLICVDLSWAILYTALLKGALISMGLLND